MDGAHDLGGMQGFGPATWPGAEQALPNDWDARAFALAPVGAIAPLEYSVLPFGVLLGWLIFAEIPGGTTIYGAAIIIAAGFYSMHRERVRARERRHGIAA